jgi:hypothetical protein
MAFKTDAADSNDTSCSPLRPPNRMPTRVFDIAMPFQSGSTRVSSQSQPWFRWHAKKTRKKKSRAIRFDRLRFSSRDLLDLPVTTIEAV